jgi:hypothetical protein
VCQHPQRSAAAFGATEVIVIVIVVVVGAVCG